MKVIFENKLSSKDRKELSDENFGIPEEKGYPLTDDDHVRKAIQFFKYCSPMKKTTLANNINKRAKDLGMTLKISKTNPFYKYADKNIVKEVSEQSDVILESIVGAPLNVPAENTIGSEAWKMLNSISEMIAINNDMMLDIEIKIHDYYIPRLSEIFTKGINDEKYLLNPIKILNKIIDKKYNTLVLLTAYHKDADGFDNLFYTIVNDIFFLIRQKVYIQNTCINDEIKVLKDLITNTKCNKYFISRKLDEINFECLIAKTDITTGIKDIEKRQNRISNIITMQESLSQLRMLTSDLGNATTVVNTRLEIVDSILKGTNMNLINTEEYLNTIKNETKSQIDIILMSNSLYNSLSSFAGDDKMFYLKDVSHLDRVIFDLIDMLTGSCRSENIKYYNKNYSLHLDSGDLLFFSKLKAYFQHLYPITDYSGDTIYLGVGESQLYLLGKNKGVDNGVILIKLYDNEELCSVRNFFGQDQSKLTNMTIIKVNPIPSGMDMTKVLTEGITIDKDGNMKFEFKPKRSYMDEYATTHRMLVQNSKTKNYEGMKQNLAFLFAMISSIERNIMYNKDSNVSADQKNDALKARTFAINDFKTYIRELQKSDPSFDFTKYYEQSGYDKITVNVTRDAIQGVKRIFQTIMLA